MRYLTADQIIDLNRRVNSPGGIFVVRDRHRVEYLVEIVRDDFLFPAVWDKAAMYLHRLATSQAFVDGNKRTALESADVFLELHVEGSCQPKCLIPARAGNQSTGGWRATRT